MDRDRLEFLLKEIQKRNYVCHDGSSYTNSHWVNRLERPPLGVDFHHTISTKCGACDGMNFGELSAGPPQFGVADALELLGKFFDIIIYTGYGPALSKNCKSEVSDYLKENGIPYDSLDCGKPPFMYNIDDRGIHHRGWKTTLEEVVLRSLQGWNVREGLLR